MNISNYENIDHFLSLLGACNPRKWPRYKELFNFEEKHFSELVNIIQDRTIPIKRKKLSPEKIDGFQNRQKTHHAARILSLYQKIDSFEDILDLLFQDCDYESVADDMCSIIMGFEGKVDLFKYAVKDLDNNFPSTHGKTISGWLDVVKTLYVHQPQHKEPLNYLRQLLTRYEINDPLMNEELILRLIDLKDVESYDLIQQVFVDDMISHREEVWNGLIHAFPERVKNKAFSPEINQNISPDFYERTGKDNFKRIIWAAGVEGSCDGVRMIMLGNVLSIDLTVQPMELFEDLRLRFCIDEEDEEDKAFQTMGHARRYYATMMGEWNRLSQFQDKTFVFPEFIQPAGYHSTFHACNCCDNFLAGFGDVPKHSKGEEANLVRSFIFELSKRSKKLDDLFNKNFYKDAKADELEKTEKEVKALFNWWNSEYLPFAEAIKKVRVEELEKMKFLMAHKGTGRNDPCPCGSGKKFKKCCAN
ncbi:MAG: SEC-C metal-binding domain-containing protein [bacterium]